MTTKTRALGATATALGAGLALALVPALSASAHVSASASSTAAGSYTILTFSVPHGCDGASTTGIDIEIPDTITSVTPTVNPQWTVTKNMVPLEGDAAAASDATERVGSVSYRAIGDGLAEGYRDTFELSLQLPEGAVGDVVQFPVHQSCADDSVDWAGDEAPTVVLTAATGDTGHGAGSGHGAATDDDAHEAPEAAAPGAESASGDVLARTLGISGLALGAAGLVFGLMARRPAKKA